MTQYHRNGIDQVMEPCIELDNGEIITMDRFVEWLIDNVHPSLDIVDKRTEKDVEGRWRQVE